MAEMIPRSLAEYQPTGSEAVVYEYLKKQLPDDFKVFYHIIWNDLDREGNRVSSECDFIVLDPNYGYLVIEVKGGEGILIQEDRWILKDSNYGDRTLPRSPFVQAELSMRHFKKEYEEEYNFKYYGIYGMAVYFPFYSTENLHLSENDRILTLDYRDNHKLQERIEEVLRFWGGSYYARINYTRNQHENLVSMLQTHIAMAAAAGALIEYKQAQFEMINRVQENYLYLLKNYRQYYIRGGAGTGKTWIAMKAASKYASQGMRTLFLCQSRPLSELIRTNVPETVEVKIIEQLFLELCKERQNHFSPPWYPGVKETIRWDTVPKYDAIVIDEAQDFTREWAEIVRCLLKDPGKSYLAVFYDDIQSLQRETFDNLFRITCPPFLLRENIRNTYHIYQWAVEHTALGRDVILNPIEGPVPVRSVFSSEAELIRRLEQLQNRLLIKEYVKYKSVVILVDSIDNYFFTQNRQIAAWNLVEKESKCPEQIRFSSVEAFKGLEADVILYVHQEHENKRLNYIAYTRARYYLYELIIRKQR